MEHQDLLLVKTHELKKRPWLQELCMLIMNRVYINIPLHHINKMLTIAMSAHNYGTSPFSMGKLRKFQWPWLQSQIVTVMTRGENHIQNPMKPPFSDGFPRVFPWFS